MSYVYCDIYFYYIDELKSLHRAFQLNKTYIVTACVRLANTFKYSASCTIFVQLSFDKITLTGLKLYKSVLIIINTPNIHYGYTKVGAEYTYLAPIACYTNKKIKNVVKISCWLAL